MAALLFKKPHLHKPTHCHRTFIDITSINWVRDRGLDHAVEKEKNLKPIIQLKNLIKSEPSKSLPLSIIVEKKGTLQMPTRPIEFIRKYPSIFEEFSPGGIAIHPHVRLTPEVINLDSDEELMYQSESYRKQAADRLLKLLMLSRINKIPLSIVNRLRWDLGLPDDYVKTLAPDFPDYFHVKNDGVLELVCWSDELAVSVMEKRARKEKTEVYRNGMALEFPMQYSRGFEMDKKFKKWVDDWQKLPYVSPYENASHLGSSTDESDKWAVGILHELLHILVPKKMEKEHLLCLGEYLGLRSRFKRALLHHPGIFYMSSKIGTHTVVLREGYKRDLLVEKHVMMGMRNQYIHLMNMVKEVPKTKTTQTGNTQQEKKQTIVDSKGKGDEEEEENDAETSELSDSDVDDVGSHNAYDDVDDDDEIEEEESEDKRRRNARKNVSFSRGPTGRDMNLEVKGSPVRNWGQENSVRKVPGKTRDSVWSKGSKRTEMHGEQDNFRGRSSERSNFSKGPKRAEMPGGQDSVRRRLNTEKENVRGRSSERSNFSAGTKRTEMPGGQDSVRRRLNTEKYNIRGRSSERSNIPRSKGRSSTGKRAPAYQ